MSIFKSYDTKFDAWFEQVRQLLDPGLSLSELLQKYDKYDCYGSFDSGESPAEFVAAIRAIQTAEMDGNSG